MADDVAEPCCSRSCRSNDNCTADESLLSETAMDTSNQESEGDIKRLSLSPESLRTKMEQESLEFAFLKPICAQLLQSPTVENLKVFESALNEVGHVPGHLSEFVAFPFAIHLKVIRQYKEIQRIQIFQSLAKLLDKAELSKSYDMFVNIYQKLHVCLTLPPDITAVNKQISEDEVETIVTCIKNITLNSLSHHLNALCEQDKIQIFGHSIFILLQLVAPDVCKPIRLKTLQTLEHYVKLCDGSESRSRVLYKFLPGIVSSLRKISLPSAGNSVKAIIIKSLGVMGMVIRVSVEYESPETLSQADKMLSQIVELLSKDFVLNKDVDYRKSFLQFCCEIATKNTQLPQCCKSVSTVLIRMKEDDESEIAAGCLDALQTGGILPKIGFTDLANLISSALSSLSSGNEVACVLALREISSSLSTMKLSFIEFQSFLPLIFQFVNEMVWRFRSITFENRRTVDPVYIASARVCHALVVSCDLDEVVFEISSMLSDLENSFHSVQCPTGVIVVFNTILPVIHELDPLKINDFEAANLAHVYLSLLDMQSTELAIEAVESDIPAVQTAADMRRLYLLEGLGILGGLYSNTVVPVILYPLIENAGASFQAHEVISEVAETSLKAVAMPHQLDEFLRINTDLILNEISVRMLNLFLYPNCPHALVYLAKYFDFSSESFSSFINQIFERSSDEFGGGGVSHIYSQVFYAVLKSISNHFTNVPNIRIKTEQKSNLMQKMLAYQKAVGVNISTTESCEDEPDAVETEGVSNEVEEEEEEVLSPVLQLVERICHRLLNFLPDSDRSVQLTAIDSLILGIELLANNENAVLPLCHTIWQNLIPRISEKDYVVVRKSFELLNTLCRCSGTFLRKRTIDEAFPKLSVLLLNLAKEGEQIKDKNRQYYTCTQAYKLQLTILQGMGPLLQSIDVQELELDKIVSGCIMYLSPNQHKNLREAARKLLEEISAGTHCRTVWMKLINCGFIKGPQTVPDTSFTPLSILSDS